jgi:hypothetical protein
MSLDVLLGLEVLIIIEDLPLLLKSQERPDESKILGPPKSFEDAVAVIGKK